MPDLDHGRGPAGIEPKYKNLVIFLQMAFRHAKISETAGFLVDSSCAFPSKNTNSDTECVVLLQVE
jgi:hypothetical protein